MAISVRIPGQDLARVLNRWPGRLCDLADGAIAAIRLMGFKDVRRRSNDSRGRAVLQLRTYEEVAALAYGSPNPYTVELALSLEGSDRTWFQLFDSAVAHPGPLLDPDPLSWQRFTLGGGRLLGKAAEVPLPSLDQINASARFLRGHPVVGVRRCHAPIGVDGQTASLLRPSVDLWPAAGLDEDQSGDRERRVGLLLEGLSLLEEKLADGLEGEWANRLSGREAAVVRFAFQARAMRTLLALESGQPDYVDVSIRELAFDGAVGQFVLGVLEGRAQ